MQTIRPGWGHTPRNTCFSGGWRERRGRSGAGEWWEFGEVGTDGAPPRTPWRLAGEPRAVGGKRPRTPEVTGGRRPRTLVATGGGRPRTPVVAGEPRAGGGDFNGNLVVYRGGDFGIICRR